MKEFCQFFFGQGEGIEFTNFSLAHFMPILVLIGVIYLIFIHGMRPTVRSAVKSYAALLVLAVIAYFSNRLIGNGANYLFLASPEEAPSVLDILLPNFLLRTLIMAAVITALYGVAYLPWYLKDRKASKEKLPA